MRRAVDAITRAGGAIMFGLTQDGGAFSLCILSNREKLKDYPHTSEECEVRLLNLEEWFVDMIT
jgi:hypothetical protein